MEGEDVIPPKPEGAAPSAETISIIREQDFEEADFSKQLDADNDWESEHPIFMTKLPDDMNEGLLALQDLKYNGETPEEVADYCKDRGNEFFAKGKKFYKVAIQWYTKALVEQVNDPARTAIYHSNRAAVNLEMGNYARAIEDCVAAIAANPSNLKAYFRAARASAWLDKFEQAMEYIGKALEIDPKNAGLAKEKQEIEQMRARHFARIESAKARQRKLDGERDMVMKQKGAWVKMLLERNVAIGPYLFHTMGDYLQGGAKPYMDDKTREMHWPVLFLYDEYRQLDFIQDFAENDSFDAHLRQMFPGGDSFCEWDVDRKYVHSQIEIYFVVNQSPAFLKKESQAAVVAPRPRKIKVNHNTPLKRVLEHPEYVIPGYPVFYVVTTGSVFKEAFLKRRFDLHEE